MMTDSPGIDPSQPVGRDSCFNPTVRERQIDFLLEEEFTCNPNFLCDFVEMAKRQETPVEDAQMQRSVFDAFGEVTLPPMSIALTMFEKGAH